MIRWRRLVRRSIGRRRVRGRRVRGRRWRRGGGIITRYNRRWRSRRQRGRVGID